MSGNMTLALLTAQSGLSANQAALDTATNNITNANSPTYSRKIAVFEQRTVNGVGAGVSVSKVVRSVDEGLLKSLRNLYSGKSETTVQQSYFQRMQDLFGTPSDNSSISHILNKFSGAIEALAVSPEKPLEQSEVVRWAQETTLKIKQIDNEIQNLRLEADNSIAGEVEKLNSIIERIRSQNEQIAKNQASGTDITGLEDQRDADLNALSEIIQIKYFTRKSGEVVVYSSSGKVLVDTVPVSFSHIPASNINSLFQYDSGDFDGIWTGSRSNKANDITEKLGSGTLKGLVDIRDNVLGGLQAQINELSAQMRDVVNQEHNRGVAFPGMQEMSGTRTFSSPSTQTITLDPSGGGAGDVAIILTDLNGNQTANTTLETIMVDPAYGPGASLANSAWTISDVAATMEDWLQANGAASASVAIDTDGKFNVQLNAPTLALGFRDQVSSTAGSTQKDVAIGFDADGANGIDETVSGFSYFFGLNDFFVDYQNDNILESDALVGSFVSTTAATLSFNNSSGNIVIPPATDIIIPAGSSLKDMATLINNGVSGVTASVVSDGSYQRLRIVQTVSDVLVVTQN
ncbi:MAG: flagellar hook-associated protein FlgK, partial [Rhodospirillaceae bacterium]|nr:flagellar hook-associated protein FlgK [Rhodospirillaceae bacterium]